MIRKKNRRTQSVDKPRTTFRIDPDVAQAMEVASILNETDIKSHFGVPVNMATSIEDVRQVCDSILDDCGFYSMMGNALCDGMGLAGYGRFAGYPMLANLSQDGLIQAGVEITADEMTRKWCELKYKGSDAEEKNTEEQNQYVSEITEDMRTYKLQALFREAATHIGYFGGCLMFIDTGTPDELLSTPLVLDEQTFKQGSFKGFKIVEPVCVAPGRYNASNPLGKHFYEPRTWFVYGKEIHSSRFLYFTSGMLPLLLRPSYNFFGIPKAQVALDYVATFTESREAAARLLKKFSLTALKTDMEAFLSGGPAGNIERRIQYFVQTRSNDGVLAVDKEKEDIVKLETPLSGVTDIVRQGLELLAAIFRIPAVKYLGISPGGFNATGESDMRSFWDYAQGQQERQFDSPLARALKVLTLNRYGKLIPSLVANWTPLGDDDEEKKANQRRTEAERDAIYLDRQVISQDEVRERLASDEDSGYNIKTDGIWEGPSEEIQGEPLPGVDLSPNEVIEVEGQPEVQDTAMNGAQVSSLLEVAVRVQAGEISEEAAAAIIQVAFPSINQATSQVIGKKTQTVDTGVNSDGEGNTIEKQEDSTTDLPVA